MKKYCKKCQKEFDTGLKKCPDCNGKLKTEYTEEELCEMQKQDEDDFIATSTFFM